MTLDRGGRLQALRDELARRGLDGFVVPRADEHQGEYVPPRAERLAWLTGFTGSAGQAVVLREAAAVFVDGRYTLQVRNEVDTDLYQPRHLTEEPLSTFLSERLKGGRLGYDPWLHTQDQVEKLRRDCEKAGGEAVAAVPNPLDSVWPDQPGPPLAPVVPHPAVYSGVTSTEKRAEVAAVLSEQGAQAVVLTLPDSIAWLINVRGGDVPRTPLPLSFAILREDASATWFVDSRKLANSTRAELDDAIEMESPESLGAALDALAGAKVLADPATAAAWVFDRLAEAGAEIVRDSDPCQLPKACKSAAELAGTRAAHRRDGAALTRFLAWLDDTASGGGLTERAAADRLEALRQADPLFRDLSFDTISGAGPNGAIVHYRVSEQSDRALAEGELYLVDSGGQYLDGTTDVTRTVAIGAPSEEMRRHFTLVLKGHIALATARFPPGTSGSQLDVLARQHLWQAGLDFDHGTGHGVGSYLGVHEGPQRISKLPNRVALKPGMIVSNEPGYYRTGAYGIRIENLVAVIESEAGDDEDRPMLAFETLTLAPIDRRLVATELMSGDERAWLDAYHARVQREIEPLVDAQTRPWLRQATAPLEATT